jgi:hypothetical protein
VRWSKAARTAARFTEGHIVEQQGFRKVVDTTFMIGFLIQAGAEPTDVAKYFAALERAQGDIDADHQQYTHDYLREMADEFKPLVDVRAFGPGERIVFRPTRARCTNARIAGSARWTCSRLTSSARSTMRRPLPSDDSPPRCVRAGVLGARCGTPSGSGRAACGLAHRRDLGFFLAPRARDAADPELVAHSYE